MEDVGDALRLKPLRGRVALVFEVEINHWVVDETLSDAREVNDRSDAMLLQFSCGTDAGELENL